MDLSFVLEHSRWHNIDTSPLLDRLIKYSKYYNSLFLENDFNPEGLKSFSDFSEIPLLSKKEAILNYDDMKEILTKTTLWLVTKPSD